MTIINIINKKEVGSAAEPFLPSFFLQFSKAKMKFNWPDKVKCQDQWYMCVIIIHYFVVKLKH